MKPFSILNQAISSWTNNPNTTQTERDLSSAGYIYKATIPIPNQYQSNYYTYLDVRVNFSLSDAMSGNYAPIVEYDSTTYEITIYSKVNNTITINSITCIPIKNN